MKWIAVSLVVLLLVLGEISDRQRQATDKAAHPEYYAHLEQFGPPLTVREAEAYLSGMGYQDIDLSHIKGPLVVPEGWLLGLVFKSVQNPNDQLFWFVKTGKHGDVDIKMYPGNKYAIPAYP